MRLIDANELVKAIKNENPGLSISGAVEKFARTAQVNMQPTVTAIPIEWIKKYVDDKSKIDHDWLTWGVDVLHMLEDWEKENE